MAPGFKQNYANKIKIVTRQISAILDRAPGNRLKEKFTQSSPEAQARVVSLLKLRKELKLQLRSGKGRTIRFSYFRSQVAFFRSGSQHKLIQRIRRDIKEDKKHAQPSNVFSAPKTKKTKLPRKRP